MFIHVGNLYFGNFFVCGEPVAIVARNVGISGCVTICGFCLIDICPVVSNSSSSRLAIVVFWFF